MRNGVSAPPGSIPQERGPCRVLVEEERLRGSNTRNVCSRLVKKIGSGGCGNRLTVNSIPNNKEYP